MGDPAVKERVHVLRSEAVADRLQTSWIGAGGESVLKLRVADPLAQRCSFGPLVPVEPHLPRPRAVRAQLDERRAEVRIKDVEVVGAHAAILLEELEVRPSTRLLLAVSAREHPLKLLAGDDRHNPEASLPLGALQVRAHVVELAVIPTRAVRLLELKDRNPVLLSEPIDLATEAVADRRQQRR